MFLFIMYNVSIPSIEDPVIINYLENNDLIDNWDNRPEYIDLLNTSPYIEDAVYKWNEKFYDERGYKVEEENKRIKHFSVYEYCRFLSQIAPNLSLLRGIEKSGLKFLNLELDNDTPYLEQKIDTPDKLFRDILKRTMKLLQKNKREEYKIEDDELAAEYKKYLADFKEYPIMDSQRYKLFSNMQFRVIDEQMEENRKRLETTKESIDTLKKVLKQMMTRYPSLCRHIQMTKACQISMTYDSVSHLGKIKTHSWDRWYLLQLLEYAPSLFQLPYYNKKDEIDEKHQIYPYHLFTYQTRYFKGKAVWFTMKEIEKLCGIELELIKELTPQGHRKPFNKLSGAKQDLVRKCFGEYTEGPAQDVENFIANHLFELLTTGRYTKQQLLALTTGDIKPVVRKRFGDLKDKYIKRRLAKVIDRLDPEEEVRELSVKDEMDTLISNFDEDEVTEAIEEWENLSQQEQDIRGYIADYIYSKQLLVVIKELDERKRTALKAAVRNEYGNVAADRHIDATVKDYKIGVARGMKMSDYEIWYKDKYGNEKSEVKPETESV